MLGCTAPRETVNTTSDDTADNLARYIEEYNRGMEHHLIAKDNFNNGSIAWDSGNYTAAAEYYKKAMDEYRIATDHYLSMGQYAGNNTERVFAERLCNCTRYLTFAVDNFTMSIEDARAGNMTGSNEHFYEGQSLIDKSEAMLNMSLEVLPEWLDDGYAS